MLQILEVCADYMGGTGIPDKLAYIVALFYRGIQIVVPILLVLWGMLDLGKAVMAQKEDEIKKGQQTFVKRILAAAIVFFVFTIVKLLLSLVAGDTGLSDCVSSIVNCASADACGNGK